MRMDVTSNLKYSSFLQYPTNSSLISYKNLSKFGALVSCFLLGMIFLVLYSGLLWQRDYLSYSYLLLLTLTLTSLHSWEEVFLELVKDFLHLGYSFCDDFLHNFFNLSHFHSNNFGELFDFGARLNNAEPVNKFFYQRWLFYY